MNGPLDGGTSDTLRPGTTLGRYEVRRLIGQGGMGCVYEGVHRDLKKRVAIKTLLPALASNSDARQRFLREGESASRIRHPHVVDVTDVGSEGSVIYLVMEYLEGEDLARLIGRQGFLSSTQAADIMVPVAAAIATAHEQSVIHRDLKPENIFLARTGYGGLHPKVLDFGISKVLGDSRARALTGSAATMGTMHYLPPEQLRAAREADARGDQYGLGTILYECVTGQRAFEDESFYMILKKIAEGEYPPPSSRRPELPARMEAVIMRAMSLDPLDRFASVKELGAALLELASDGTRGMWTPFFGAAPAFEPGTAARRPLADTGIDAGASGSAPRVPTMLAPSAPAGATMELPVPAPRASASTTMRNATGERALPPLTMSGPRRSRVPWVIAGVTVVAGIAALIFLRGNGAVSRRGDPEATDIEAASASSAAAPARRQDSPREPAPGARELKMPPMTAPPAAPMAGATTATTKAAPGAAAQKKMQNPTQDPTDDAAPPETTKPGAKAVNKIARKGVRLKKIRARATPAGAADEPESRGALPNNAPIIPD